MNKKYTPRPLYAKKVKPFLHKDLIKVFVGQRRAGKSYLLHQTMDILQKEYQISEEQILFISKEDERFEHMQNHKDLTAYVQKNKIGNKKTYLFIDEVQEILEFEKAIRSFQATGDFDIYISGSNAHMLSSELSTHLAGRYIEIEVFPLSYLEFLDFHKKEKGDTSFQEYLRYGGLPYLIHLDLETEVVFDYLKNVCDSILLKDIVQRYQIRNVSFLKNLIRFLAQHTGSIVSAKKISNFLKQDKINISPNVVLNYLSHLSSVFFIFEAPREEIGKKIFSTGAKHYFGDTGLRNAVSGYTEQVDIGKILENIVYLHLRNWGFQVHIGVQKDKEIDFIAKRGEEIIYIQACYLISDASVREREFGNLLAIKDNHKKIVISYDPLINGAHKGIEHRHILDFLTNPL